MKLLIDHSGYHLRNLGDLAMLQGAVRRFRAAGAKSILVIASDAERLKKHLPEVEAVDHALPLSMESIRLFPIPHRILLGSWRQRVVKLEAVWRVKQAKRLLRLAQRKGNPSAQRWIGLLESADAVVATGGGYLTDAFEGHALRVLSHLGQALALGKPIALMGQGIGPVTLSVLKRGMYHVLLQARTVGLREPVHGVFWLQEQGLPEGTFTGDDALELIDFDKVVAEKDCNLLGINLRLSGYAGLDSDQLGLLKSSIQQTIAANVLRARPVPIDFLSENSDEAAALGIIPKDCLDPSYRCPYSPLDVIRLAGDCSCLITGSYHAALFALAQGVPVIAVEASDYYAVKFSALEAIYPGGIFRYRPSSDGPGLSALYARANTVPMVERNQWINNSFDLQQRGRKLVGSFLGTIGFPSAPIP